MNSPARYPSVFRVVTTKNNVIELCQHHLDARAERSPVRGEHDGLARYDFAYGPYPDQDCADCLEEWRDVSPTIQSIENGERVAREAFRNAERKGELAPHVFVENPTNAVCQECPLVIHFETGQRLSCADCGRDITNESNHECREQREANQRAERKQAREALDRRDERRISASIGRRFQF